ncbi:MAG: NAD(P)/FAD-dependent oxidoreductase [Acidobacteriota bacterium]
MKEKIAIVGAGPAGSSLAIRLAVRGFDVTLIERESFPRHKLCGEFISPECFDHFAELGLLDEMISAGGDRVFETTFFSPSGRSVTVPSSFIGGESALSLSRAEMDLRLLKRAESVGVCVFENAHASDLIMKETSAVGVGFRNREGETISVESDILVDATGRAAALTRLLRKRTTDSAPRSASKPSFVGFKTHLRNVELEPGHCEIYFFKGGYIGITNIEGGLVNACFMVDARSVREFKSNADDIVRSLVLTNSRARKTLSAAKPVREWLAVPLGDYGRKELNPAPGLYCVGDSAAFIDPFTGSGMLLALESSELLCTAITENSRSSKEIANQYARAHALHFNSRLRTAALLRRAAFVPFLTGSAIRIAGGSMYLTELLARLTRRRAVSALSKR